MSQSTEIAAEELLAGAYADFNARRIDAVLVRLHPEVEWANGMEGGHEHGRDAVRAYWTRQWAILDPHVDPLAIERDAGGRWVVEVHQVVHDVQGKLLLDTVVHHAYRIADGLIERMDILEQPNT
ncbi:MAG TPA: nuclear transport factor 2 family protein [Terracidiphilus sp.]|nr:nuclear transport factor 2 family protein [Terracidiphilus sp.]